MSIHLKAFSADPFTWMTHLLKWPIHLKGLFSRPIQLNDQMTHSVEWPICLNDPFTWKPFQQTHSLEWPIYSNDPFTWKPLSAEPFSWMIEWPIQLNDPFTQMTHSPFTWMTNSLEWPIHSNGLFNWMTHSLKSPFQQTHSLKWPIRVQWWNVSLPVLSNNTIWSYEASDVINLFWKKVTANVF